ncbi:hypothetical protein [Dokdonella sp.]|uniref:hypothetical protein n=1 Tax=Dokdonella sp. TaxID=2291710 RepID=UPI003C53401F
MLTSTRLILLLALALTLSTNAFAATIFSEDFQDGNYTGWTIGGSGSSATANLYASNYSLRLRNSRTATQSVPTTGYTGVSISSSIAAYLLEWNDTCVTEISTNGGSSWTSVNTVVDGQDNGVTLYTTSASPAGIDNNPNVQVRLRSQGNNNADYCYFDDIEVTGTGGTPPPPACDYDCLPGDGTVSRSSLTYSTLQTAGTGSLVDMSAFAVPSGAADPSNTFQGTLSFTAVQRGWSSMRDTYSYSGISNIKKLPDFNYQFVQHGTHLIPVNRGLQITSHPVWELILEPGRVWNETSDSGFSRAAIPFALQEYGANCTHNGVMSFLFKNDGSISSVAYEIASETCNYYQFNLYGRLSASYTPASVANAATIKSDYVTEVSNRMPTQPISALATDYPGTGISTSNIGSEQSASARSAFGVAYNGVHYTGGCDTRYGTYPYCDVLDLPSYSVAKSTYGGYGLMAMEQLYPGVKNLSVYSQVSTCPSSRWNDVKLENLLDMSTGNYTSSGFEVDEGSTAMLNGFFLDYSDSGMTSFACSYPRKVTPGTSWVYHTSDTYLLGRAMDQYLGQDSYTWMVNNVYKPLKLSPTAYTSVRTFDASNQQVSGFGLTYHRDDVVKLAELVNNAAGTIGGTQKLKLSMVNEVLQTTAYHGLNAGSAYDSYDNGFWIWKADTALGCGSAKYIPYMSGFGGISVVLLPNNMVYYFFSDNAEYTFNTSVGELDKIADFCN